jgi:hypothetical protein
MLSVGAEAFCDLVGQLARRRQHEDANHAAVTALGRRPVKALKDGKGERRRLAGPGLGAAQRSFLQYEGMAFSWMGVGVL